MDLGSRGAVFGRANDMDVSVLAPKEKKKAPRSTPFRGPEELIAEIDKAAKELGLSRNEAMNQLLRFALDAHKKDQAKKRFAKD